jgi:hypothetical protein
MIAAISSRLIWPRPNVDWTGSVHSATAEMATTAAVRIRLLGTPEPSMVSQTAAISAPKLSAVIPHASAAGAANDAAAKIPAANGGYVNGLPPPGDTQS